MSAVYSQPHPKSIEAHQASSKCHPDLMKPSTSLPTLTAAQALHLPIDDSQTGWLNCFLTNTDILNDIHLNTSSVGSARMPQRFTCAPGDVTPLSTAVGCFPRAMTQLSHKPVVTIPSYEFGVQYAKSFVISMAMKSGSPSPVAKAMPNTWQSSMEFMPPRTLMFLITEWSGTG